MYKNKKIKGINFKFFMEHADEIINDMEHIINPYSIPGDHIISDDKELEFPGLRWNLKRMRESHYEMWMMFGPGRRWTSEELTEINRKYCEDTGRWELFNWE